MSPINNNISTVLSDSSDDELGNKKGPEPIIYDDDLIFDDDEDAKSEAEEPNEQYLPSTDHYRRIFLNASTKIPTNNLFDGLINNQFIPEKFQIPKQWQKTFKSSDNLSGIISCIMLIRKRVVDRKKKSSSKVDIGYRFPLKQVLGPDDRFEMNELASKFYMSEEKSRTPYLWLHYYPPNQNAGNRPVQDFFKNIFPSLSDNERIETVHQHNRTECFAIGIHDRKFENLQYGFSDCCHILAAVSFCLLKNTDESYLTGAYIYYLGTLPEIGVHEILPTNKVMKEMKFLVEGNGFAPKLIRIIQELSFMLRSSKHVYLGANVNSSLSSYETKTSPASPSNLESYYKSLNFVALESWDDAPPDTIECVEREAENKEELVPMYLEDYVLLSKNNGQRFITRHGNKFLRNVNNQNYINSSSSRMIKNAMKTIHNKIGSIPHEYDDWLLKQAAEYKIKFGDSVKNPWVMFQTLWQAGARANFHDTKKLCESDLRQEMSFAKDNWILPLEDQLMEYCSIGPRIRNNQFKNIHVYSVRCHFCDQYMTRQAMTLNDVKQYGRAIIEAHYVGTNNHVLAINTRTEVEQFNEALKNERFDLRICMGIKKPKMYRKIWKASMLEYDIGKDTFIARAEFTRSFFTHYFKEYTRANVLEQYFNRAIRGSERFIATMDKKVRRRNDKNEKECNYQVPDEFAHIFSETSVKFTNIEQREEYLLKSILNNKPDEEKLEPFSKSAVNLTPKKRKPKKTTKQNVYSDDEIKLNWQKLMCFNYDAWPKGKPVPSCLNYHNFDDNPIHYVGLSIINKKKVHFEVSTNIIPVDSTSYIFSDNFMKRIGFNREVNIEDSSKEKLLRVVNSAKNTRLLCIIPQAPKEGVQYWKLKFQSGRNPKYKDHAFIERNFKVRFPNTYKQLTDVNNINMEIEVPAGSRTGNLKSDEKVVDHMSEENSIEISDDDEEDDDTEVVTETIPVEYNTAFSVEYQFGSKSFCAFGNMANALHECGDKDGATWFFMNRHQKYSVLSELYLDTNTSSSVNEFMLCLQILRQRFQYTVRFLGSDYKPWENAEEDRGVVKIAQLQNTESFCTHVVCIVNNYIIDGSFRHFMKLSESAMKWICNDLPFVSSCYSLHMSNGRKHKIESKFKSKKRRT